MDILLTHGYFLGEDRQEQRIGRPYPPLGLLYLSAHLKTRGFRVSLADNTFRKRQDFLRQLEADAPSVVGLYVNLMTKPSAVRLLDECRRRGRTVVVGGPEPATDAEAWLDHGADVVVVGEGEITLEELLPRLLARPGGRDLGDVPGLVYRDEHGRIVRTAPRALLPNLDALPFPDREAIDVGAYLDAWRARHGAGSVSLLTARGCPYTCRWCSRSVFGESHRRRSPERVAVEVEWILDRYHPEQLWYTDDVFTIHPGWLRRYEAELRRRGLKARFECISRADRVDAGVADTLAALGCARLWIGAESGSQRVLDAMDRRVSVEQVQRATGLLQQRGIEVGHFIMLGYPGEEPADLRATVDSLKRSRPDTFLTTVAYPIRGTEYHRQVKDSIELPGSWRQRTDRDARVKGRRSRLYYECARRWMTHEVARDSHWRRGAWLRAAGAGALAGAGRLGMALLEGRREAAG